VEIQIMAWITKASEFLFGRSQSRLPDLEPATQAWPPTGPPEHEKCSIPEPNNVTKGNNGDQNHATPPVLNVAALVAKLTSNLSKLLAQYHKAISAWIANAMHEQQATVEKQLQASGLKIGDEVIHVVDKHCQIQQAMLQQGLLALGDRIIDVAKQDSEAHWSVLRREMTESCSTTTQRAAQRPIVDQLIALYDRIDDERAFLNISYRKEPDLGLNLGCRQLQERSDSAIRSFAAEVLIILRAVGVEPFAAGAGRSDPRIQNIVGVEPTSQADLDGHIARIIRAGFTWNGTQVRPESVIAFKKGA
jgi:molecular chaperone GrpE (heat shock protein)